MVVALVVQVDKVTVFQILFLIIVTLLTDSNTNVNSMINRRGSLFYRYPLEASHHVVFPCTLESAYVVCSGTSELVSQQAWSLVLLISSMVCVCVCVCVCINHLGNPSSKLALRMPILCQQKLSELCSYCRLLHNKIQLKEFFLVENLVQLAASQNRMHNRHAAIPSTSLGAHCC